MLLAFSRDLRVVLLRLASRLQTLRYFAASKRPCPPPIAAESMQVFAPLANRLGIWQIKWELGGPGVPLPRARALQDRRPPARREARRARGACRAPAPPPRRRPGGARPARPGAGASEAHLQHLEEDGAEGPGFRARARRPRVARHRARRADLLCRARPGARALPRGRRRVRRLHRPAEGQRLPVAAHRRARTTTAGRSRSRSAPRRCTSTPSTASRRTGPTRRPAAAARPASAPAAASRRASPRPGSSCCASCSRGSANTWSRGRIAPSRATTPGRCSTTASTSSRRRPRWSS